MNLDIKTICEIGDRTDNQDYLAHSRKNGCYCFVVCDGLGGHKNGAVASKEAVATILSNFNKNPEFSKESIRELTKKAQQRVMQLHKRRFKYRGLMTTVAIVLVKDNSIITSYVGDSRIYIFKDSNILYQSKDHSLSQEKVTYGEIETKEIRKHPDRNKLFRSLGKNFSKPIYSIKVFEQISNFQILICSDGFWENVLEEEMIKGLSREISANKWISNMLEVLTKRSINKKIDNYTAIAIISKN